VLARHNGSEGVNTLGGLRRAGPVRSSGALTLSRRRSAELSIRGCILELPLQVERQFGLRLTKVAAQ